jgi:6-phosphofructokinase 1
MISKHQFGRMVAIVGGHITSLPLEEVAGKTKLVTPDNDLILQGERMGVSFGV